jgi:hypothetical protein
MSFRKRIEAIFGWAKESVEQPGGNRGHLSRATFQH